MHDWWVDRYVGYVVSVSSFDHHITWSRSLDGPFRLAGVQRHDRDFGSGWIKPIQDVRGATWSGSMQLTRSDASIGKKVWGNPWCWWVVPWRPSAPKKVPSLTFRYKSSSSCIGCGDHMMVQQVSLDWYNTVLTSHRSFVRQRQKPCVFDLPRQFVDKFGSWDYIQLFVFAQGTLF